MDKLLTSAALIGILTACWAKIKMFLSRLWSIVIVSVKIEGTAATAVKAYCWKHFKRSPFGERVYGSDNAWVRPISRLQQIGYEKMGSDPIIFWKGWRPMLVGVPVTQNNQGIGSPDSSGGTITFLRGSFNIDNFLIAAMDEYNKKFSTDDTTRKNPRFFIRRFIGMGGMRQRRNQNGDDSKTAQISGHSPSGTLITTSIETGEIRVLKWKDGEIGPDIIVNKKALDALAFPPVVGEMIKELRRFIGSEEWYRSKMIQWTRGWMLYGPPGTGKTSLVRAIGQDFDLPIFVFDLASMSNEEFMRYWDEMRFHSPCIALMEDLDGVFVGRKNVTGENGGGLTFDCFLNALSGVEGCNGVLKVMTTNNIGVLDEALGLPRKNEHGEDMISTRPGRADRAFELNVMTKECRLTLANRILCDCPNLITAIVNKGEGDTPAQFQDRCAQIALKEYWKQMESEANQIGFDVQKKIAA